MHLSRSEITNSFSGSYRWLLLLFFGLLLQYCKEEVVPEPSPSNLIKGEWKVHYYFDYDRDTLTSVIDFGCNFTSDSTFTILFQGQQFEGEWAWTTGSNYTKIDVLARGVSASPAFDFARLSRRWVIVTQTPSEIRLKNDTYSAEDQELLDLYK